MAIIFVYTHAIVLERQVLTELGKTALKKKNVSGGFTKGFNVKQTNTKKTYA